MGGKSRKLSVIITSLLIILLVAIFSHLLYSTLIHFSKEFIYWVVIWYNIASNTISFCTVCHCMGYGVMFFNHLFLPPNCSIA
ncbi:hypothetical protein TH70_0632 [Streptococcus agalactiae]|nr:hypothetical protein TH70_0632 [Streptococcus agalactiae]